MLLQTDFRRRATLPPIVGVNPGDALELEVLEDERIPLVPIPRLQLWTWTTKTKEAFSALLKDMRSFISVKSEKRPLLLPKGRMVKIEIRPAFDAAIMGAVLSVHKAAA